MTTKNKYSRINASELRISLQLDGDLTIDEPKFKPTSIDQQNKNAKRLLFIPTVLATYDDLVKSKYIRSSTPDPSDYMTMFDTSSGLTFLFAYLLKRQKIDDTITIEQAEDYNYIEKNIDLILRVFFNAKNSYKYNGISYSIHSIDWNGNYIKTKNVDGSYTFSIDAKLYVFNKNKTDPRSQLTGNNCEVKKLRIINDIKEIGNKLFNKKSENKPYLNIPKETRTLKSRYQNRFDRRYQQPYNRRYQQPYDRRFNANENTPHKTTANRRYNLPRPRDTRRVKIDPNPRNKTQKNK